ncbi:hypothetical protein [Streptomyces sp. TR06-5]
MRRFFTQVLRVIREMAHGIDSAHAIRHGLQPSPAPLAQHEG